MTKGDMALYLFTKDGKGPSDCYDECAVAWPPLLTKGKPVAGQGAIAKKLGTTRAQRRDPPGHLRRATRVYLYEHDRPGVILCQDVFEFGGTWLLVNAAGKAVR